MPMNHAVSPGSPKEALRMLTSAMSYLSAADATQMAAETQAQCLQALERVNAMGTAARSSILGAFTSGQGYSADADYSPRAWLINKTQITKGAAVAHTAWVRRAATHPEVTQALAMGEISESFGRTLCLWTDKLPGDCREAADAILVGAAKTGMGLRDLAELAAEILARSRSDADGDSDDGFEDRGVKLLTTFQGAGVLTGDLTPECAAVVSTVLDALSAPAGAEDTRSQAQRYHDALHEALQRLVTAGLLPERAGQPAKVWAHVSLADLMLLDGSSALLEEWTARVRAQWAGHRAGASFGGSDGAAWLDGDTARAAACDASVTPVVTGEVNYAVMEDLFGSASNWPASATTAPTTPAHPPKPARPPPTPPGPGKPSSRRSSAKRSISCPVPAASRPSCGGGSSAPGWAARACRWTSATPRPSRPGSATRSPCATSTASGPAGATSPPRPARSTTSGTRPTAARPALKTAFCCASSTTRS